MGDSSNIFVGGDLMTYWRKRRLAENHRKVIGLSHKEVSDELIQAEEGHTKLHAELKKLKDSNAPETEIAEKVLDLGVFNVRYRRLMAEFSSSK